MQYILLLGAFQALVALGLFAAARHKKPADSLLNWMLVCLFTHLSIKFTIYDLLHNASLKVAFNTFIDLAYGPLLWMYARKITNDHYQPRHHWYLYIPTFGAAVIYIMIVIGMMIGFSSAIPLLTWYNKITQYLILLSFLIYPLMSFQLATQLPSFWQIEKKLINRISLLFIAISSFWLISFVAENAGWVKTGSLAIPLRLLAYIFMLLVSLLIIHYRLTSAILLRKEVYITQEAEVAAPEAIMSEILLPDTRHLDPPARKAIIAEEQYSVVMRDLIKLMQTQKVFTDPDLTLEKLAAFVNIPRNQISETLNQHMGKSFYQFVNEFRAEEVIRLLDQCKKKRINPSILSLAFEAGFQSKTTFNLYFKKTTGQTPSAYLKKDKGLSIERIQTPELEPVRYGRKGLTV